MKVLATRRSDEGYKLRRILLDDGKTKDWTIEIPLSVWKGVSATKRAQARKKCHENELIRRQRKAAGIEQIKQGIKPAAIAHHLGVSARTVQEWGRELNV